jgi:hypothetical protein
MKGGIRPFAAGAHFPGGALSVRRHFPALRVTATEPVCSAVCNSGNSAMLSMQIHRFRSSVI